MSATGKEWAKRVKGFGRCHLPHLVLQYLGDRHDPKAGYAYPTINEVSADLGISARMVKYAIRWLEGAGLISTVNKGNQYRRTHYALNMQVLEAQRAAGRSEGTVAESEGTVAESEGTVAESEGTVAVPSIRGIEPNIPKEPNYYAPSTVQESLIPETPPPWFQSFMLIPGFRCEPPKDQGLLAWVLRRNVSAEVCEDVVSALSARLEYQQTRQRWRYVDASGNSRYYTDLRAAFQGWTNVRMRDGPARASPNGNNGHKSWRPEARTDPKDFSDAANW